MVLKFSQPGKMTENRSTGSTSPPNPELRRNKLRSSFRMIRKLLQSKRHRHHSARNGSTIQDGSPEHDLNSTPPPPYRSNSISKSVSSVGSSSSGILDNNDVHCQGNGVSPPQNYASRVIKVVIQRETDALLGIVISVSVDKAEPASYPVVRRILPDSQASRNGHILAGDELLSVNGIDVIGMTHRQVTSLFKKNGKQLQLILRRKLFDGDRRMTAGGLSPKRRDSNASDRSKSDSSPNTVAKNESHVIEICRQNQDEDLSDMVQMSSFHPGRHSTKNHAQEGPELKSDWPSELKEACGRKESEFDTSDGHFGRRAYSASAASRPGRNPRHTLLVPGGAQLTLMSMQDAIAPQSAPASPAESRRYEHSDSKEESEGDTLIDYDGDVTEAWSAAPFVRSYSMRHSKRTVVASRDSAAITEGHIGSYRRFRDSFRLGRKSTKHGEAAEKEPHTTRDGARQRTDSSASKKVLSVTLDVPSLQEVGLRLSGGSVSPYGACSLTVQGVSTYGTAKDVLQPGDHILKVDGIATTQMTAFEAYRLLQNYLGKSVQVLISRSTTKDKN